MTLNITPEQEQIIIDALLDRIGKLYDMSEQFKGTGFIEVDFYFSREEK